MNIDDEGKRCFEEEEITPRGFFLTRRYSDTMEVEEINTTEYSWEMNVSGKGEIIDWRKTSVENIECLSELKEARSVTATTNDRKESSEKVSGKMNRGTRKKKSETSEQKSVSKKNAEMKTVSTTVSVRTKRDSITTTASKSSSSQKTKLGVSKRPVSEKSSSRSPMRATRCVTDSDTNSTTRSPSPIGAKRGKTLELGPCGKQKGSKATSKSSSSSPTRLDKARRAATVEKSIATKLIKSKEESFAGLIGDCVVTTKMKENVEDIPTESNETVMELLRDRRRMKIVLDFDEFPPPKSEKKGHSRTHTDFLNVPEPGFYLSPIEENSEASIGSGQSKIISENYGKTTEATLEYDHARKYHTYPKSRIPVARWSKERRFGKLMDPKMYPLEPREIDLEAFQQLHTADSQEELQEFLLLESQCSGNLGLAGNMSTSEVSCNEPHSEDERGTMSDY